jgi:hypothetical protein
MFVIAESAVVIPRAIILPMKRPASSVKFGHSPEEVRRRKDHLLGATAIARPNETVGMF